ncbi:MAG: hypothetical protein Q9221_004850 [Calogaya cf. arnoldii]
MFLTLDWSMGRGREAGCFDAEPRVAYSPYAQRSLEETKTQFDQHCQEWNVSEAKFELQQRMAQVVKYNQIMTVVSFGTGSLQDVTDERFLRSTSLQICALATMTECISTEPLPERKIWKLLIILLDEGRSKEQLARCFSQDPVYTDYDKEILRSMGIEPADDPDGFNLTGKDSLVCEWAAYDYITRKISERPWPAVIINGTGELERFTELVERDESVEYEPSFYDSGCQRDILIGVHKKSRYHQIKSGERILIFETINPIEAQHILDMYEDREQQPLSAFPYLCDLSLDPSKGDKPFWQPTIYWRKDSVSEDQEKGDTGEAIIDMYLRNPAAGYDE